MASLKLCSVSLLLFLVPAFGHCAANDIRDDFGTIPLGSKISSLPPGAKEAPGCEKYQGKYSDCAFSVPEGLTYSRYENEIVSVAYDFTQPAAMGVLGLKSGDNPSAVQKLEAKFGIKFARNVVDGNTVYGTDFREAKSCLTPCAIFITFDKNSRIKRIDKQPESPAF